MSLPTDGTYVAQSDDGTETLWPRALYPSAEQAIEAHHACEYWAFPSDDALRAAEAEGWRLRIVWAWRCANHPEGVWWYWTRSASLLPEIDPDWPEREIEGPPVECWAIA